MTDQEFESAMLSESVNTTTQLLTQAVTALDAQFGEGYAAAHSELTAAFVAISGATFNNRCSFAAANNLADQVNRLATIAAGIESGMMDTDRGTH